MTLVDRWLRCPYASVSMVRLELLWFNLGDTSIGLQYTNNKYNTNNRYQDLFRV